MDYENGFGNLDGEFWIGLKNIHPLTYNKLNTLRISVGNDTNTSSVTWHYPNFSIDGPDDNYRFSGVSGGEGNSRYGAFGYRYGDHYFSTFDRDNDQSDTNCGYSNQGGWWYYYCSDGPNPNGRHVPTDLSGTDPVRQRLVWRNGYGYDFYTHSEMKIRPYNCVPRNGW